MSANVSVCRVSYFCNIRILSLEHVLNIASQGVAEAQAKAPQDTRNVVNFLRSNKAGIKVRTGALNGKRAYYFKGASPRLRVRGSPSQPLRTTQANPPSKPSSPPHTPKSKTHQKSSRRKTRSRSSAASSPSPSTCASTAASPSAARTRPRSSRSTKCRSSRPTSTTRGSTRARKS